MTQAASLKVSVIVPAYKPGDGIRRVVDSLAAQTLPQDEFELIIVDDGSPDDTWERLQAIRDERPNVRIERIENSGWPSRPRNVGIGMARGEYVLFMDHDDEIFPDGLRASYEYAVRHHADVLNAKELKTSDPRWGLGNYTANVPNALPKRGIGALMPMMPHKLYRRDFLLEHDIRFPEGRRMLWEDVYFNVECYKYAQVVSVLADTPVYLWHSTGQNNSATYGPGDDEFWDRLRDLFDFIAATLDTDELAEGRRRQLMHQYRLRVLSRLNSFLRSGKHPDREAHAVDRALEIIEKHIPQEWDADLPAHDRPKAWLLRRRRVDLLRRVDTLDRSFEARSRAAGMVWVDGVLHVRTTTVWSDAHGTARRLRRVGDRVLRVLPDEFGDLPDSVLDVTDDVSRATATLSVRERTQHTTWTLPTTRTVDLVPVPGSEDLVTLRVVAESRLDPARAGQGARLARGVWDVRAKTVALGAQGHLPVETDDAARATVSGSSALVAYRNEDGGLTVDTAGGNRSVVDAARPRTSAATVTGTRGAGRRSDVSLTVPLDGLRVHPVVDKRRVVVRGAAELVAPVGSPARRALLKARRRLGASSVPGEATVTVQGEDVTLTATAQATPGLWQLVLSLGGRRPAPLFVRIARDGTATLVSPPARPHAGGPSTAPPKVSVVVPVHNAERFVEEAIGSVFAQTLPAEQIEIVAVDDGSTDDSLAVLRRLAGEHPRMRVLTQPGSGSAAAPRNAGIEAATGTYLFFLDADDLLTPHALEKLVEAADLVGADVAFGRLKGIGGRGVATSMFAHSTLDADMVRNHLVRALGPTKMFRREHVLSLDHWFRPGLRNGEDLAFVLEAELTARRIVVLADGDYYVVRGHDGVHMSRIGETLDEKFAKAWSVAEVIERHTEPGAYRDALLVRPFAGAAVEGLFRNRYLKLDPQQRHALVERVVDRFGHLWTPGLRAQLPAAGQVLLELVFQRRTDLVSELVEHAHGNVRDLPRVMTADGFVLDVPPAVATVVGRDLLGAAPTATETQLTAMQLRDGSAVLRGWLRAAGEFPAPDGALARWTLRGDGRTVDVPTTATGPRKAPHGPATGIELAVETTTFPVEGVWDLTLAPTWGDVTGPFARFGGSRSGGAGQDAFALGPDDVLFGTATHGNLSFDHGGTVIHAPAVRVVGARWDDDGRPEVLVTVPAGGSSTQVYALADPAGSRGARQLLPCTRVDETTLAARLPVPRSDGDAWPLALTVAHDGILTVPELADDVPRLTSDEVTLEVADGTLRVSRTATTSSEAPA